MIKKDILLHIGLYRTGSTFLEENLRFVKSQKVKIFLPRDELMDDLYEYLHTSSEIIKKKIIQTISKLEQKKIIISSEGIFGHQSNGFVDVAKRFNLLENLFNKPKYIIFFREPSSIVYSLFFEGYKKKYHLQFIEYSTREISSLAKTWPLDNTLGTNFKIFDYNKIFTDYLKISNRVLFVEFENFFSQNELEIKEFEKFLDFDLILNFKKKINISLKNLIYLDFYNKFIIFRIIKMILLTLCKIFTKENGHTKSIILHKYIALINKIIPKKIYENFDHINKLHVEKIKNYHSKNYQEFKNKINK